MVTGERGNDIKGNNDPFFLDNISMDMTRRQPPYDEVVKGNNRQ